MKAIILAAGQGTRLRPYTLDRPKCLVEINGLSLLELQLSVLRSRGVDDIVLVGGYRADMLRDRGTRLFLNPRYATTNMVWTLFCAEEELHGDVIVSYGDIAFSGNVLDILLDSRDDVAVAIDADWEDYWRARSPDPLADAESLRLGPNQEIIEIGQRASSLSDIEGQYMGLMKFTHQGVQQMKHVFKKSLRDGWLGSQSLDQAYMTDMLQAMVERGYRVSAVVVQGQWVEIDSVADILSPVTRKRLEVIRSAVEEDAYLPQIARGEFT